MQGTNMFVVLIAIVKDLGCKDGRCEMFPLFGINFTLFSTFLPTFSKEKILLYNIFDAP